VKAFGANPARSGTAGLGYFAAGLLAAMLSQPSLASAARLVDPSRPAWRYA